MVIDYGRSIGPLASMQLCRILHGDHVKGAAYTASSNASDTLINSTTGHLLLCGYLTQDTCPPPETAVADICFPRFGLGLGLRA